MKYQIEVHTRHQKSWWSRKVTTYYSWQACELTTLRSLKDGSLDLVHKSYIGESNLKDNKGHRTFDSYGAAVSAAYDAVVDFETTKARAEGRDPGDLKIDITELLLPE